MRPGGQQTRTTDSIPGGWVRQTTMVPVPFLDQPMEPVRAAGPATVA